MTPDELSKMLLQEEYLILNIPPEEFQELEQHIGHRAYTYRPALGQLTIKMATQMHGTVSGWAFDLITAGIESGAFGKGDLYPIAEGRMSGFTGEYQNITKAPDMAIVPGDRLRPTIVFEFGYTEPYEDLKADAKLLLQGSEGAISKVIVIKLNPLGEGETQIQKGFVEMWHFVDGKAKKDGGRKNLFPQPKSHKTQRLELTLGDILREEFDNLAAEGWELGDTIVLELDPLREAIVKATKRHLIYAGVLPGLAI